MLRNIWFVAMLFIKRTGIFIFFEGPDNHFLIIPFSCQRFSKRQQLTANPLRLKRWININPPELKGLELIRICAFTAGEYAFHSFFIEHVILQSVCPEFVFNGLTAFAAPHFIELHRVHIARISGFLAMVDDFRCTFHIFLYEPADRSRLDGNPINAHGLSINIRLLLF